MSIIGTMTGAASNVGRVVEGSGVTPDDQGWQNVYDAIGGGVEAADDLWCLINPRRPGCPGDPNRAPDTVVQNFTAPVPGWVYIALVFLVGMILFLSLKK